MLRCVESKSINFIGFFDGIEFRLPLRTVIRVLPSIRPSLKLVIFILDTIGCTENVINFLIKADIS